MGVKTESDTGQHQRLEDVKKLASRIMHMHYCEHDIEGITSCFSEQFSWMGAGEQEYLSGRQACADHFRKFRESIPDCNIWDEEYDVVCPMENVYVVMGRMWIATDPGTRMYLKVHQRVTFVFRDTEDGLTCSHIHCSNPYQEMLDGESFPEKIGRQSYEYVQERLNALEEETKQQNRQLEVSEISRQLKAIALELKIPVLACAQLSRAPAARTDKRPMLRDLRDSGSIEQDADVVLFLHREGYYASAGAEDGPKPDDNAGEIIIAKQRNGPVGVVNVEWQAEFARYTNLPGTRVAMYVDIDA